jgi:hypothetical protein
MPGRPAGQVAWEAFAERQLRDALRAYQRVEVTVSRTWEVQQAGLRCLSREWAGMA